MKHVIRGDRSGVYLATLVSRPEQGLGAVVTDVQRVWSWKGALETITLAAKGPERAKMSPALPGESVIADAREIFPCTPEAEERFAACGVWGA